MSILRSRATRAFRRAVLAVVLAFAATLTSQVAANASPVPFGASLHPGSITDIRGYFGCSSYQFGISQIILPRLTVTESAAYAPYYQFVYWQYTLQGSVPGQGWQTIGTTPMDSLVITGLLPGGSLYVNASQVEIPSITVPLPDSLTGNPLPEAYWVRAAIEVHWHLGAAPPGGVGFPGTGPVIGTSHFFFTVDNYVGPQTMDLQPGGACLVNG